MRMMLRVEMPADAGTDAIADGSLPVIVRIETLKPEAAFFYPDGGQPAAVTVFGR